MKNTVAVILSVFVLAGCTLMQMREENKTIQNRITQKEKQLYDLEEENRQLAEKERLLLEKLEAGKLNLGQISKELDVLIRENQKLVRMKKERQKSVKDLQQAIENMKNSKKKIAELEQQDADAALKKKKIEALREEIRQYLDLGLKPKYR